MSETTNTSSSPDRPTPAGHEHEHRIDLEATARLVATGEMDLPEDLPAHIEQVLIDRVRELRRDELIDLIAEAIAHRLWREAGR